MPKHSMHGIFTYLHLGGFRAQCRKTVHTWSVWDVHAHGPCTLRHLVFGVVVGVTGDANKADWAAPLILPYPSISICCVGMA